MSAADIFAGRLAEVVRRYGRNALTEPVALRAALREVGAMFTEEELEALTAVAGSPELAELPGDRDGTASAARQAIDGAAERIAARTGLPAGRLRWACAALAAAMRPGPGAATESRPEPTLPPRAAMVREHRVDWDAPPAATTHPVPLVRRPRLWLVAAVAAAVAVVVAGTLVLTHGGGSGSPPPPDRYAVDQVALRYRALGARLLDGVARCAPLPARPGELERVGCDVGAFSFVLATYDAPNRLDERRAAAAHAAGIVRTASNVGVGAGFVMREVRSGQSLVYWDVDTPRPVSATVTAERTGLPELVAFYDARQFGALKRPDVPGAAFSSGVLWKFAEQWVSGDRSARCRPLMVQGGFATELVRCPMPDGATFTFGLASSHDALRDLRVEYSGDGGKVRGSVRVRTWDRFGGPTVGQLITFVDADDHSPGLYFDEEATLAFGDFSGPPHSSPSAFLERWRRDLS